MTDFWSFLLQTLTATGAAALLLVVKAMFRDKLSPRWQFAVWSVLGLTLLVPAGLGGRYALVNWPLLVEAAKSALTGEYGTLTQVSAPIPLPAFSVPGTVFEWLYAAYVVGVGLFLVRYTISYARLRCALRHGRTVENKQVRAVAEHYGLPDCPAVEVDELRSAFVCGIFRPVLVLPAGSQVDDKVILHELLHLKYRDVAWGLLICLFRCVHWCNPVLWACADLAGNDLESLCDQRVLERLEGEGRREYGRILLSMADERYARVPGTSSMANGARNIRRRIEAIARFKRYPAGMFLVSVCVVLVLAAPLLVGVQAQAVDLSSHTTAMASARTVRCTTYAGALDTYAKAVLERNLPYRAMCAPLAEQNALAASYRQAADRGSGSWTLPGLPQLNVQSGYEIYNLAPAGVDAYECLLVVEGMMPPAPGEGSITLVIQPLRAEKQGSRWVVVPQGDFRTAPTYNAALSTFPCDALPAWEYEAGTENFTLRMRRQTSAQVESYVQSTNGFWPSYTFDTLPRPDGSFTVIHGAELFAIYTGDPADKGRYTSIGASSATVWAGQERPELGGPGALISVGSSSDGLGWGSRSLEGDWEDTIFLSGGGSSTTGEPELPESYAVNFYLNGQLAAELTLLPVEGGMADG